VTSLRLNRRNAYELERKCRLDRVERNPGFSCLRVRSPDFASLHTGNGFVRDKENVDGRDKPGHDAVDAASDALSVRRSLRLPHATPTPLAFALRAPASDPPHKGEGKEERFTFSSATPSDAARDDRRPPAACAR